MKPSLAAFFLEWAAYKGWTVPLIHLRVCHFLEHRGELALLMIFRGAGKSTLIAIYNAWKYWRDPTHRILHQGDQDRTAYKTSRDTKSVLQHHPWTAEWARDKIRGDTQFWWVPGANDERNPSMQAAGILSGITSSRADEVQNDDVEVLKNIVTPEAREALRHRLGEQVHIAVPGARKLYIGTPHTHDSLYDEVQRMGADKLIIPMFAHEHRVETATATSYRLPFTPEIVFAGIGEQARALLPGRDFRLTQTGVEFSTPPGCLIDFYAGCAWPEYFTPDEMLKRRRETRTINYWDSQYQLHSKPTHEIKLDPNKLVPYAADLRMETANRKPRLMLGKAQILSSRAYWDPSKGKAGNDASALSLILDDANGNQYWHCAEALIGDLAEFKDQANSLIVGGQVMQLAKLVKRFHIPSLYVETNGIGGFVGPIVRRALRQEGIVCGVVEVHVTGQKNGRILAAIEPPLSSGVLWAHERVLDGPTWDQMKDWNPITQAQDDDYLDSCSGALLQAPVRITRNSEISEPPRADDWRPRAGAPEVVYQR